MNYRNCRRCDDYSITLYTISQRECLGTMRRVIEETASDNGYCAECATKRRRELQRSDDRRYADKAVASRAENLRADDCGIVAIAKTTGVKYSKVLAMARKRGYGKAGRTGMQLAEIHAVASDAARLVGKSTTLILGQHIDGANTVRDIVAAGAPGSYIITAQCRLGGHAMSLVDGTLYNANSEWYGAKVLAVWKVA